MPLKLYAYLAAAVILAGLFAYGIHIKHRADKYDEAKAQIASLNASIKRANEATHAYQADLNRLQSERAKPLSVRLCKPARLPSTPTGTDGKAPGHVGEAVAQDPGPDIGEQLLNYAIDAEANALQLERLQAWIKER